MHFANYPLIPTTTVNNSITGSLMDCQQIAAFVITGTGTGGILGSLIAVRVA